MHCERDQSDQERSTNAALAPFVPVPLSLLEHIGRIGARALMVYVFLVRHRNYKTGCCNPSVSLLAREMKVSHDTVQRGISILEAEGFLIRASATGQRNVYEFPGLTTRMDASSSEGTTRMDAAQPDAPVRNDHTQLRSHNKEEQEVFNKTLELQGEVLVPEPQLKYPSRNFQKPTLKEVAEYCRQRGNSVDSQQFLAFYDSNGWKVGRNPMRDWRAAVITWERRGKHGQQPESKQDRILANLSKAKAVYHA
jgi:hypothetical protein